jgi:hypothetical protein
MLNKPIPEMRSILGLHLSRMAIIFCISISIPSTGYCWSMKDIFGPSVDDVDVTCEIVGPRQITNPKEASLLNALGVHNPKRIAVRIKNRSEFYLKSVQIKYSLFDNKDNRVVHDRESDMMLRGVEENENIGEIAPGNTVIRHKDLDSFESAVRVECRLNAVGGKK